MTDFDAQSLERLMPLPADQWGDPEYSAFGKVLGIPAEHVPRAGSGDAHDPEKFDVIGLLVRHPHLAKVFLTYNTFLQRRGELPPRLRELAILRVTHQRRAAYEWGQHVRMAAENDIDLDDISRVVTGNAGFEGADLVILEATDELLDQGQATWDTWQRLVNSVGEKQAMELIFVVGTYVLLAMAFRTWRLPPAAGTVPLP
jgi:4-carboxymuconolactone decarboxylase